MITFYSHNIWNSNPSGCRNTLTRSMISDFDPDMCTFQECGPQSCRVGNPDIVSLMSDVYNEATPEFADVNVKKFYIETNEKALIASDHCPLIGLFDM